MSLWRRLILVIWLIEQWAPLVAMIATMVMGILTYNTIQNNVRLRQENENLTGEVGHLRAWMVATQTEIDEWNKAAEPALKAHGTNTTERISKPWDLALALDPCAMGGVRPLLCNRVPGHRAPPIRIVLDEEEITSYASLR